MNSSPMSRTAATPHADAGAVSRRTALKAIGAATLAVGAGGLFTACGSSAPAKKGTSGLRVSLGWVKDIEFAGFWLAVDRGYYRDEGLDVTFIGGGTNTPLPHVQVAAGSADIAVDPSMLQVLQVIPKGNDLVLIGAVYQTDPTGLLSLAKHPVRHASDLPGLKILSQQGTQPLLNALYKANHLTPDYRFVPAGFDPGALVEGQGQAYNCFVVNQPITLEQKFHMKANKDYFAVTYGDLGCPAYSNVIACKRTLLDSRRKDLEAFMRASVRGWQDNAADPTAAVRLVVEKFGVDLGLNRAQQTRQNELQIPLTQSPLTQKHGLLRIDADVMRTTMYPWLKLADAGKMPDPSHIVDKSVLDAVFKNGARV